MKYFDLLEKFKEVCGTLDLNAAKILANSFEKIAEEINLHPKLLACFESKGDLTNFCHFLISATISIDLAEKAQLIIKRSQLYAEPVIALDQ